MARRATGWLSEFFRSLFSPACAALKGGATFKLGQHPFSRELLSILKRRKFTLGIERAAPQGRVL